MNKFGDICTGSLDIKVCINSPSLCCWSGGYFGVVFTLFSPWDLVAKCKQTVFIQVKYRFRDILNCVLRQTNSGHHHLSFRDPDSLLHFYLAFNTVLIWIVRSISTWWLHSGSSLFRSSTDLSHMLLGQTQTVIEIQYIYIVIYFS